MRKRGKSRFSPRASKRKNETESRSLVASEPQPNKKSRRNESEQRESSSLNTRGSTVLSSCILVDKYCWLCHTETNEEICVTCHRAFHKSCLTRASASFNELQVCQECQSTSVDGTKLKNKFFNLDKLKKMLDVLTRRTFAKKRVKNEIFLRWTEENRDKLFKIIDFEILLDNINRVLPYTKTAEFYGDVKFLYHNCCIVYGANSDEAKAAENLRRDFKTELLDLEACPECYYHLYCDEYDYQDPFVRLCDFPHDIVWAQLTGHPYWPAKCLKVVKGVAHVKFFGEHEQANIPVNKCFFMSESHPKNKNTNLRDSENSGPKSQLFKSARLELLEYIRLYQRRYGTFAFYPHKTPYKPQERNAVSISAEGNSNRNSVQLKLEGIVNEDSEANVINAATVMEYSGDTNQNSVTNDITALNGCLNNRDSPVTSINMSFSADEQPSNIENIQPNPVVTSIESLQPTVSPHIALSSVGDNSLNCELGFLENIGRMLLPESSKGAERVNSTEILSSTIANNASNDSPSQPDSLSNIVNNFPIEADLNDEVHIIGEEKTNGAGEYINPAMVLPMLTEGNPEFKSLIDKARYLTDGILIHSWASFHKNSNHIGRISKLYGDLKKYKSELKKTKDENDRIMKEETDSKYRIQSLTDQLNKLQSEKGDLQSRIQLVEQRSSEARTNAKFIISNLKSGCAKKIEEMLKLQFMDTINEKDSKLQDAESIIKSLEEDKRQLEKELKECKIAKQSAEEKLKVANSQQSAYRSDSIREFKKTHYCYVCELPAAFVCCLNTSYCSSKCQAKHAEEHRKHCKREITSQSVVQQTVSQKTVVYAVNMKETSTINDLSNSVSGSDSMAGFTHHKKAEIHRVSALPVPSTSHNRGTASSSRSSSSKSPKSKQRFHR